VKWILCGKNDAAVAALEHMLAQGDEVWAIGAHGDAEQDGWQRSFPKAARSLGVRFDAPRRINAPAVVDELAGFGARGLISIQYDQILKDVLFERVGCPCLNLHYALLPRHRGVAPIAWAILSGDDEAGVTLHHMVEDIDAGDLLAQARVPVGPETTGRELYDAVSDAAAALFVRSYPFPQALLETRLVQDASRASYHRAGDFDFSRRGVDWSRPAVELQRWLRAMIFPPRQHPELRHGERILGVIRVGGELGPPSEAPHGTVLELSSSGARVACGGGSILLRELSEPLGTLREGDRLA
jgi:methionyl-tRNA formyltransferase